MLKRIGLFYCPALLLLISVISVLSWDIPGTNNTVLAALTPTPTPARTSTPRSTAVRSTPTAAVTPTRTRTPGRTTTPRTTPTPYLPHETYYVYEVLTGDATNITTTTATLNATAISHVVVRPTPTAVIGINGIVMALVYWEAGDSSSKITAGTLTIPGKSGGGIIYSSPPPSSLTVDITNLKPGTTYMYQAIVQSGITPYPDGEVKSFTTLGSSPVPTATPARISTTPTPTIPGNIKVQFYNQNTAAATNQLYLNFQLVNTGNNAIALSNVKIRYYYTADGTQAQSFWCDYAPVGSGNVIGAFVAMNPVKTGADTFVEVGFTSGAGSLAPGSSTTIQARLAKNDWSNYNQTNDYSFNSTAKTYVDWTKTPGYISGALKWGTEP